MSNQPTTERLTWSFADAPGPDRHLLGGKGAGLVEMVKLGLPVPPGFVLGTPCGRRYLMDHRLPEELEGELGARMAALEEAIGRSFGDPSAPLLVSVRSGAPVSMPGMMDTVLNVGLTVSGAEALAAETGDPHFAWGSLERLLEQFARTVRGIGAGVVEEALLDHGVGHGGGDDASGHAPGAQAARARCEVLLELIERESGAPFPDPAKQLRESIEAVFKSWNSPRAKAYRRHKDIDEHIGTAVVVQSMVFGNRGEDSGSGVAFTRDPSTGAQGAYGDFLFDAQGEDVVAGERDTLPLAQLGERLPDVGRELEAVFAILERDARDLCDVEFTVEQGRLWILQTRVGQRSGRAAVRIAVALAEEGLISREEAVRRVSDEQLEAAGAPVFASEPPAEAVLARGLAASPGAAVGRMAFDAERAQALSEQGEAVVLLRPTTSPADLPGVIAAVGVVTGRGGRTSHAAVVARGMGRPAVCGAGALEIASDRRSATLEGVALQEGEVVSVDGDRGVVARGELPLAPGETDPALARFLQWRKATEGEQRG
jgi:pyruvate, orthophosphate dikinase